MKKILIAMVLIVLCSGVYGLTGLIKTFSDGNNISNSFAPNENVTRYLRIPQYSLLNTSFILLFRYNDYSIPVAPSSIIMNDSFIRPDSNVLGYGWDEELDRNLAYIQNNRLVLKQNTTTDLAIMKNFTPKTFTNISFTINCSTVTSVNRLIFGMYNKTGLSPKFRVAFCAGSHIQFWNGAWTSWYPITAKTLYHIKINKNVSSTNFYIEVNNATKTEVSTSGTVNSDAVRFSWDFDPASPFTANIFVLNITSNNPTLANLNYSLNVTIGNNKSVGTWQIKKSQRNLTTSARQLNGIASSCNCDRCALNNSVCYIPINFRHNFSYTIDYNISIIRNASYDYGIYSCLNPNYNFTILNMTYKDEINFSEIPVSNNYDLDLSSPFPQNITGLFSGNKYDALCTNINLTQRGLTYNLYGSLMVYRSGYVTRSYVNTLATAYSTETSPYYLLPLYLIPNSTSYLLTLNVKDYTTQSALSGVSINAYRNTNGTEYLIDTKVSDAVGKAIFYYSPYVRYRFTFYKSGYTYLDYTFDPITASEYTVFLFRNASATEIQQYDRVSLSIEPNIFVKDDVNDFSYTVSAPDGGLIDYGYNVTYSGGSFYGYGNKSTGSTLTKAINMSSASLLDMAVVTYWYHMNISGNQSFTITKDIITTPSNYTMVTQESGSTKGKTYGLGLFERIFVSTLIVIFAVGMATLIGQPFAGIMLGMMLYGYMVYIGFIPLWSVLVPIIIGLFLVFMRSP